MNRRVLWSLLLALLLPLAQVAAAAHEVTHVKSAPVSIHCDECAAAAAVSGGAATTAPLAALPVHAKTSAPVAPAVTSRAAEPFVAFSSRAPPSLP